MLFSDKSSANVQIKNLAILGYLLFIFIFSHLANAQSANANAQAVSLSGRLYSNTQPATAILDPNVNVVLQVLDYSQTCILYEEQQTIDTQTSEGYFEITLGSPKSGGSSTKRTSNDQGHSLVQVFSNNQLLSTTGINNTTGAACTYTPNSGDSRFVHLRMTLSTDGSTREFTPNFEINSAPTALVAESLQGYTPTQFLFLGSDVTQARVDDLFSTTNYPKLTSLLNNPAGSIVTTTTGTIFGASTANANLTIESTSNASRGNIFLVSSGGRVGIGTSSVASTAKLTVNGAIDTNGNGIILGDSSGNARTVSSIDIQSARGAATQVASGTGAIAIGRNNTASGKDAIVFGRSNIASANEAIAIGASVNNTIGTSLQIGPSDAAKLTILSSGNLGVGTSAPNYKVDVSGDVNVTGLFRVNGIPLSVGSAGSVMAVEAGAGLSGGLITTTGTISLSNSGVTAASYGAVNAVPGFTVDAFGRITGVTPQVIAIDGNQITAGTLALARLPAITPAWSSITGKPTTLGGYGITDGSVSISAGNGLLGGTITSNGTLSVNTGVGANQIVQLNVSSQLPALDASLLQNLTGAGAGTFGSATQIPQITVDANGRITNVTTTASTFASSQWLTTGTNISFSAGYVGIGTTSPGGMLEVYSSNSAINPLAIFKNDLGVSSYFYTARSGSPTYSGKTIIENASANPILFNPNGGNVGIGTTTPANSLTIGSPANRGTVGIYGSSSMPPALALNNSNQSGGMSWNLYSGQSGIADFSIFDVSAAKHAFVIQQSTGHVGVGTTTPSTTLEVVGNIKSSVGMSSTYLSLSGNPVGTTPLWVNAAAGTTASLMRVLVNSADKFLIDSNGNVGIGTATPQAQLDIASGTLRAGAICDANGNNCKTISGGWSNAITSNNVSFAGVTAATASATVDNTNFAQIWNWSTDNTQNAMTMTANSLTTGNLLSLTTTSSSLNSTGGILSVVNSGTSTNGVIARIQSNSSAGSGLTVLANGNVGIGTTSPGGNLHVVGVQVIQGTNAPGYITLNRGTSSNVIQNGDVIGEYVFAGHDGTSNVISSQILALVNGNVSTGSVPMDLVFATGTGGGGNQRMRITSNGNVGIGTASPVALMHLLNSQDAQTSLKVENLSTGTMAIASFTSRSDNSAIQLNAASSNYSSSIGGQPAAGAVWLKSTSSPAATKMFIGTASNAPMHLFTNDITRLTLDTTGNVGIGTSSPTSLLSLFSTAGGNNNVQIGALGVSSMGAIGFGSTLTASSYSLAGDGNRTILNAPTGDIEFRLANATAPNAMVIKQSSGNVGIGTATPNARLDIGTGTMRAGVICDASGANCKTISGGWSTANNVSFAGVTAATATATIDNTNFAQIWNWSTDNTQNAMTMTANSLTTGNLLSLTTTSSSLNSTGGLLNVVNSGTSTNGVIARIQSNSIAGSGLTVLANGSVGIGTTAPDNIFTIETSSNAQKWIRTRNLDNGSSASTGILFGNDGNPSYGAFFQNSSTNTSFGGANSANIGNFGSFPLTLFTSNSERMRIDQNGNVGIGTTTPSRQLHIYGGGQTTANLTDAGGTGSSIFLQDNGAAGGSGGFLLFGANGSGTGSYQSFAAIKGQLANGSGTSIGDLAFSTRYTTSDTNLTERMRITSGGNVGIGTTSPTEKFEINGALKSTNLLTVGAIGANTTFIDQTGAGWSRFLSYGPNSSTRGGLYFFQATSTNTSQNYAMTIDPTGNVGIGTTSPVANAILAIKDGHIQIQQTTAPTAVVSANLGTSATCTLSRATDSAGIITMVSGSASFSAGTQCTITFNKAYSVPPIVIFQPANSNAAFYGRGTAQDYVNNVTTTGFEMAFQNAMISASKTMIWFYSVIETQ